MKGRSGGSNRKSLVEHRLAGTFRRDRHASMTRPLPGDVSSADRRQTLQGLGPGARRVADRLIDEYGGWDAASLQTLKAYAFSCERLETLQQAVQSDSRPLYKELRCNLQLLRALNLEIAR